MTYPKISTDTLARLMGPDRWKVITKAIDKKYGKATPILIAHHAVGPVVHVNGPTGKCLGTVAKVESWAIKFSKEK